MPEGTAALKVYTLKVSHKIKHTLPIRISNPTPTYLLNRNKNFCPYEDSYATIHYSFIHNSPKLETNIHQQVNAEKKIVCICTMEYYSMIKMNKLLIHATGQVNLKNRPQ